MPENDIEERIKLLKRGVYVSEQTIEETKEFLEALGIPYVQALEEADPQCAGINLARKAYGVVSEDWDTLIFGSERMITNFKKKGKIIEYNLGTILNELNLTYEQFVELAIVLGCDYCDSISCYSIKKSEEAYELFKKYNECKDIEKLIEKLEDENNILQQKNQQIKYKIPENFKNNWKLVKQYFMKPKILDPRDEEKMNFTWQCPKYCEMERILMHKHGLSYIGVRRNIEKFREMYNYYSSYNNLINFNRKKFSVPRSNFIRINRESLNACSSYLNENTLTIVNNQKENIVH